MKEKTIPFVYAAMVVAVLGAMGGVWWRQQTSLEFRSDRPEVVVPLDAPPAPPRVASDAPKQAPPPATPSPTPSPTPAPAGAPGGAKPAAPEPTRQARKAETPEPEPPRPVPGAQQVAAWVEELRAATRLPPTTPRP